MAGAAGRPAAEVYQFLYIVSPPADFPLCFPKENDLDFNDFPPPADFPLCFPKGIDLDFKRSASGGLLRQLQQKD